MESVIQPTSLESYSPAPLPAALPSSLLEHLSLDNKRAENSLIRATPEEATPLVKEAADRRLLSLTDRAITGVEDIMQNGQPKERLAASLAILDRSPATKPKESTLGSGITLPAAAVEALIQGLGNLFNTTGAASNMRNATLQPSAATPADFEDVTGLYTGEKE